jgi:DNA repair protein RadC
MEKLTIKSWSLDDRPREKLVSKGKKSLSDAELIAILIGSGNREESAVALSKRILNTVKGNINALAKLSVEQLTNFKGIGEAKAISIITALELGKRRQLEVALEKPKITCSKDAYNLLQPVIGDLHHEEFWVLFLNNSNKVLENKLISKGGLTATIVDVRLLFKRALELGAVAIIVSHNHPSGKLEPSEQDKLLTKKIKEAGITLDIKVLDHLIITEKAYFSFADEGVF